MAHSKPYVASAAIQTAVGFPGELVEDWQAKVIAKMGDMEAAFVYVPPIKGLTPAVVAAQLRVKF